MKNKIAIILIFMFTLFITGCNNNKNDTFKYIGLKVYDPVYVAYELGYFEEEGLDFELLDTVAGGSTATQLVSSQNVQGGLLSLMAIINSISNGMDVVGVTDIQSSLKVAPLEKFYVRTDSGIDKPEQLKGKRIAINLKNSSFHYTVLLELEKYGIKESEVQFIEIPFAEQLLALENKSVDMIGLMVPYSGIADSNNNYKVLFDAVDVFGEKQFTTHIINNKWADKNPDKAKAFVNGIVKAVDYIKANQEEAKVIMSKYIGVDAKYINDYHFQENAKVVEDDVDFWINYMYQRGEISSILETSKIATNKYNERIGK